MIESADERALRRELQELVKKREALDNSKRRGSEPPANGVAGRRSVFARLGVEPTRSGGSGRQVHLKENNARANASRRLGKRENEDNRQITANKRQRLHSAVARPEGPAEERTETSRTSIAATSPSIDNARSQQRKQRAVAPYAQKDGIARSRRMFGALMGHLGKAKRQIEKDTDLFKRQDTKQHEAEEREKKQSQNLEDRARHEAEIARLEALVTRTELSRSEQIARAKLEHLTMVRKSESQSKFLVTISSPPIHYLPARHTKETEDLVAASMEAHEAKMKTKAQSHHENLRKLETEFAAKLEQLREELDAAKKGDKDVLDESSHEKGDETMDEVDEVEDPQEVKREQHGSSESKDAVGPAKASAMEIKDEDVVQNSVSDSEAGDSVTRSDVAVKSEDKKAMQLEQTNNDGVASCRKAATGAEGKLGEATIDTKFSASSGIKEEPKESESPKENDQSDDPAESEELPKSLTQNDAIDTAGDSDISAAPESAVPVESKKDWSVEVEKMKVPDLRKELKTRGLDTKGLKAKLVQRLKEATQEADEAK